MSKECGQSNGTFGVTATVLHGLEEVLRSSPLEVDLKREMRLNKYHSRDPKGKCLEALNTACSPIYQLVVGTYCTLYSRALHGAVRDRVLHTFFTLL